MGRHEKTLQQVLFGTSLTCADCCFNERIRGDHHIFARQGIEEILNLQPLGAKARGCQVKQVRNVVLRYKLEL